ncbi:MAG: hypothetical protein ACXACF_06760 [Candidatus Hermodarchaeia archaeon]
MDSDQDASSAESEKLTLLRQMVQGDAVKRELLRSLSDGLWHTTSELARSAREANPVIGLVTVGTILTRMQEQLGEYFLEQMVQKAEEGVSSWRIGVEWLDVVNEVLKQKGKPAKPSIFDE